MSIQALQEDIEQKFIKITNAPKEKQKNSLTNELLAKIEKNLNEIKQIQWSYVFQKKEYLQNKPLLLKILYHLIINDAFHDYNMYISQLLSFIFECNDKLDNTFMIDFIAKITNKCNEFDLQFALPLLEFLMFDCIIQEQTQKIETAFLMLSSVLKKTNRLNKYKIDIIVETSLLYGYTLMRNNNENKITTQDSQIIFSHIISILQFYLRDNKSNKKNEIVKLILSLFILDYNNEHYFLKDFFNSNSSYVIRMLFDLLSVKVEEISSFIDFNQLELTQEKYFFEFDLTSDLFNKTREEQIAIKCEALNNYNNTLKSKLQKKINREMILKNSIIFLGELWGQIDNKIVIPYVQILKKLSILISPQLINHQYIIEILNCLLNIIKVKGKTLFEEWTFILDIIKKILSSLKPNKSTEHHYKIIEEILSEINTLYLYDNFNCNLKDLAPIFKLDNKITNEWVLILKCKVFLSTQKDFLENIEYIVQNVLMGTINNEALILRNYILELLRYNYIYSCKVDSEVTSKETIFTVIEGVFRKYFQGIITSEKKNLVFLSHVTCDILFYTKNISFFNELLKLLLFQNQIDFTKNDKYRVFKILIVGTLKKLMLKLNNDFQKEKMKILKKEIFSKSQLKNEFFLRIAVKLLKHAIVNKDYFFHFSYNEYYKNTYPQFPCLLVLDYKRKEVKELQNKNNTKEVNKQIKRDFYSPFMSINFSKVYYRVIDEIKKPNNSYYFKQHLFDFLVNCSKNIFLFKVIDYENFIWYIITNKEYLNTIDSVLMNYIYDILINIASYKRSALNSINQKNQTNSDINDDLYYNCIQFLLNIWRDKNKAIKDEVHKEYQKLSIANPLENLNTELGNVSRKSVGKQVLKVNNNIGELLKIMKIIKLYLFLMIYQFDFEKRKKINQKKESQLFVYGSEELTKIVIDIIELILDITCVSALKHKLAFGILFFLFEVKDLLVNFDDDILVKILFVLLLLMNKDKEEKVFEQFTKTLNFKNENIKNDFHEKDLLKKYIKTPKNLDKSKSEDKVIELFSRLLSLYYMKHFDNSEFPAFLFNIISSITQQKSHSITKNSLYLDLCKWYLYSGNNRNNAIPLMKQLSMEERSKMQMYIGEKNIIVLHPITDTKCRIAIRNAIANICLTFEKPVENNISNPNNTINDYTFLLSLIKNNTVQLNHIEDNRITKDDSFIKQLAEKLLRGRRSKSYSNRHRTIPRDEELKKQSNEFKMNINSANIIFHQIANIAISPKETFKYISSFDCKDIIKFLNYIDSFSLYHTYQCGVVYLPNWYNVTEDDILSFDGEVTEQYLHFINKLGNVADITIPQNESIEIGQIMNRDGKDGKYVLQYSDSLCNIIFHVGNLITSSKKKSILYENKICIVFVEKYYKDYSKVFTNNKKNMIYILLYPVSNNFYLVNIKGNEKSKKIIWKLIERLIPLEFVINIENENGFMLLRRIVFEIKMLLEIENLMRPNFREENNDFYQYEYFYNKNKGIDMRFIKIEEFNRVNKINRTIKKLV